MPYICGERHTAQIKLPLCTLLHTAVFLTLQPFSEKSRTATVPKVFQIGLCGVVEADLELFCNSWSAGVLGERLYVLHFYVFFCPRILRDGC